MLQSGNEALAPFYQSNINLSTLLLEESQHIVWNIDYYLCCYHIWYHMF